MAQNRGTAKVEKVDRLERLTDLVLVLLSATSPLPLRKIAQMVPGYPEGHEALRQAFERDKRTLKQEGIPVVAVEIDDPAQVGYRIRPEDYYLPELGLTTEEQVALNVALGAVHLRETSGSPLKDALWRIGLPAAPSGAFFADLPLLPALPALHQAMSERAMVTISYKGEQRHVDPARLWFRSGRWYLVAYDRGRGGPRTFRVDRIEGAPRIGAPRSAEAHPEISEVAPPNEPWRFGEEEPVKVRVRVDMLCVAGAATTLGEACIKERLADGSAEIELEATNIEALESFVLGFGAHAEVIEPSAVRSSIIERLRAMASQPTSPASAASSGATMPSRVAGQPHAQADRDDSRPPSSPPDRLRRPSRSPDAAERLRRLLAILPELARRGTIPISELAERFSATSSSIVADLELAACCGLPPFTPEQLMEIIVDETTASAGLLGAELKRPRRLTPEEGFALAAAARAILAVPGAEQDGPLASGLAKLDASLSATNEPSAIERAGRGRRHEEDGDGSAGSGGGSAGSGGGSAGSGSGSGSGRSGSGGGGSAGSGSGSGSGRSGSGGSGGGRSGSGGSGGGRSGSGGEEGQLLVQLDRPPALEIVRGALESRWQLEITYHSAWRDEVTTRTVDPLALTSLVGHWYLDAYCHVAGDLRRFRVDRIIEARPTGKEAAPPEGIPSIPASHQDAPYVPGPDTKIATVRMEEGLLPRLDAALASAPRALGNGMVELDIPVEGGVWLGRTLLRLGRPATVLWPPHLADAQAKEARRVLAVYGILR